MGDVMLRKSVRKVWPDGQYCLQAVAPYQGIRSDGFDAVALDSSIILQIVTRCDGTEVRDSGGMIGWIRRHGKLHVPNDSKVRCIFW